MKALSIRQPCAWVIAVGQVDIVDCVEGSDALWYVGVVGFVLAFAKPPPFRQLKGAPELPDVGMLTLRKHCDDPEVRFDHNLWKLGHASSPVAPGNGLVQRQEWNSCLKAAYFGERDRSFRPS